MGVFRRKLYAVAPKIETTPGVWAAPTYAADAVPCIGQPVATITPLESGERPDEQSGTLLGNPRGIPVGWIATVDIPIALYGKRSAAGVPFQDVFLRGLGFSRVVDATAGLEKVSYADLDTGHESFSLLLTTDEAEQLQITGCTCTRLVRRWQVGQAGIYTFSVRGYVAYGYNTNPAEAAIAGLALPLRFAPPWKNNTVLLGPVGAPEWGPASAQPLHARTAELTVDNTVADRLSAGAADAFLHGVITDRRISLTMDVERVQLTAFNPYDVARADAQGFGAGVTHQTQPTIKQGTTQYLRDVITGGTWAMGIPGKPAFDGLGGWGLNGALTAISGPGGRALSIVFD